MSGRKKNNKFLLKSPSFIFLVIGFLALVMTIVYVENQVTVNQRNININDLTKEEKMSLESLKKVDDHPLYVMTYYGDYGFKEYLKRGKKIENTSDNISYDWACSCFGALSKDGEKIYGRNLDWRYSPKLLLFTDPPEGYASVSMVDISYLGFFEEEDMDNATEDQLRRLLEAPYLTFDGLNECGVAIGEMSVYGSKTTIDPNKVTLGANTIIRLVLDYAKNVDEAIELFQSYNLHFPPAPPLHYLVSDAEGNSAIIEYIDGEMKVIRNENPWQVATNFFVYGSGDIIKQSCNRYTTAENYLSQKKGLITEDEAMELLNRISQPTTQWSIVYNMTNGNIKVSMGRKYDKVLDFKLTMKNK